MKLTHPHIVFALSVVMSSSAVAGIQVEDGLTKYARAQPGDTITGKIRLSNSGSAPGEVRAYKSDYLFYADGKNIYGNPGSTPRSNSSWVKLTPEQVVIPAKESAWVYYTIQVPNDSKLSGTYWSLLMIEPLGDPARGPTNPNPEKNTMGLQTVMRYAVQLVVDIGETGKRQIKLADKRLLDADGKRVLRLDIENTGETWLRPLVKAEVYNGQGSHVGSFGGARTRVFPGCSVRQSIEFTSLGPGSYNALIIIDNGDESVWAAQYALDLK